MIRGVKDSALLPGMVVVVVVVAMMGCPYFGDICPYISLTAALRPSFLLSRLFSSYFSRNCSSSGGW